MAILSKIRRWFHRDQLSIREITRRTGLSRNTVRHYLRSGTVEPVYPQRHALGSTIELRNAAQVQTVQYTYDPYGGTVGSVASSNTIKYTGREQDTGDLYYYRNRYFKPSTGRFVSEDPIGLAGGSNLYSYVGGNPFNWVDPMGLDWNRPGCNWVDDGNGKGHCELELPPFNDEIADTPICFINGMRPEPICRKPDQAPIPDHYKGSTGGPMDIGHFPRVAEEGIRKIPGPFNKPINKILDFCDWIINPNPDKK